MTVEATTSERHDDAARAAREIWALGDYHRFAQATVWPLGPELVRACGIVAGDRVLDVAAGTGNVALRAAEAGADVVASDITPESLAAGRHEAERRGLAVEWIEADARRLPFGDGAFDVVTSAAGAMFAPDHRAVADELVRVCRPGGTIGMINYTPDGLAGPFFALFDRHGPAAPESGEPPLAWGTEEHVRELLGDCVASLELTRKEYVERSPGGPLEYRELYKRTFGPVVALYAALAGDPERLAALDEDFLELATRANRGAPGGPAEYVYEYLLVVARRR